jgi:hypothetical protein
MNYNQNTGPISLFFVIFQIGEVVGAGGESDGASQNSGKKMFEGKVISMTVGPVCTHVTFGVVLDLFWGVVLGMF